MAACGGGSWGVEDAAGFFFGLVTAAGVGPGGGGGGVVVGDGVVVPEQWCSALDGAGSVLIFLPSADVVVQQAQFFLT